QKRTHLQQQEAQLKRLRQQLQQAEKQAYEYQAQLAAVQLELEQTHTALHNCVQEAESAGLNPDQLRQAPLEAPELQTVEKRLRQAQKARERLGAVNMTAIEASAQLQAQMRELETQMADIRSAVETLQQSIRKIDRDSRRRLRETFDQVNAHFMRLFPVIFRGGKAQLQWLDPDMDPLENGVLVMAQPPGKRTTRIQMLSGGEKTLTALALIFALFELNPAPFCVLDEVDAPLDDANVMHFCELVKAMAKQVQFILITHNKTTMTMAEQLLGVTMHEPGVSRVVSVDLHTAVDMIEETA
ncbi:MAG TPA: chromosome segregation protein SMC, partial [Piscirickettsiaceae bacterium]|nr:chromosome segregation protein SMC [Piscirickettsiaceae bacterium]